MTNGAAQGAHALYVFCLARADAVPSIDGTGLDHDRPLELVPVRDIIAVVSAVSVDDFCGPATEARMRDLGWIGPRACRHEEVIESIMRLSPVVPARFATLFSSRASLEAWVEANHDRISHALERLARHEEWAVKGTLNQGVAEAPLIAAALARSGLSASPGARYLEERRIRAGIGQEVNAWVKDVCEVIARQLLEHAADLRERPVGPAVSEDEGARIFNWAFLIPSERVDEFRACVQRTNATYVERGVVIDCSGPWPPYSFCPSLRDAPQE